MWRTDRGIVGPTPATTADIAQLNKLFSEAFTDRYRRDGLHGVRVPYLNPAVWRYAISNAGEGAMLWRDGRGALIAFNLAHLSGREGWMGPLAVRQDHQGRGLGRRIVMEAVQWLSAAGVTTIGLETMPRTVDNIGFYSTLGFRPGPLTVSMQGDASSSYHGTGQLLSRLPDVEREAAVVHCRELVAAVGGAGDYSREIRITLELGLGDVLLVSDEAGSLRGFALWHHAALVNDHPTDDVRILKLVAVDRFVAMTVIRGVSTEAARRGAAHVSLRCQSDYGDLFGALIAERFQVQWTDLRMHLASHPEPATTGIVLSNWEI